MAHLNHCTAASLLAVTLLAAPLAGARTPRRAAAAHPAGSELRGGAHGVSIGLAGGVELHLASGARVRFQRSTRLMLGKAGEPQTPAVSLDMLEGRIDIDVPRAKPPRIAVLVRAPHKVSAVVEGGHGIVLYNQAGVTVAAASGDMVSAVGKKWRPLPEGMALSVGSAAPSGGVRAVPRRTQLGVSNPLLLSVGGKTRATTAVWLSVPGAVRYNIFVSRPDGSLLRTFHTRADYARIGNLAPGRYEVRAQPVDRFGLEGPVSAPDTVRVVGVKLPPGSFLSDGAVIVGRNQRVHLSHTDGVEVSYDAANTYIPVPRSIGLARAHATRVRFRIVGANQDSATLALAPSTLSARVEIGPELARWPDDTVTVHVRLVDSKRHPMASWLELTPRVTVNASPVQAQWTRRGNDLRAVVPTPTVPGPWVVRVSVVDQFGQELGRNFLEVAESSSRVASAR